MILPGLIKPEVFPLFLIKKCGRVLHMPNTDIEAEHKEKIEAEYKEIANEIVNLKNQVSKQKQTIDKLNKDLRKAKTDLKSQSALAAQECDAKISEILNTLIKALYQSCCDGTKFIDEEIRTG